MGKLHDVQGDAAGASSASAQAAAGPPGKLKRLRKADAEAPQQVAVLLRTGTICSTECSRLIVSFTVK